MSLFLNVLTVLEVIAAEFISIWTLSQKKHSFAKALGLYLVVTIPLLLFMCLVAIKLPGYSNGSGKFMLLGFLYFIPAVVNYGGDWKSRIIIAFYSFSYGLAIFSIAVRGGYLFRADLLVAVVFIIQTILYAVTLPIYLRFSKAWFVLQIQRADPRQKNMLMRYTIASFFLIMVYNNTMVEDGSMVKKLLVYLLLIYFLILTYKLVVSYLKADGDNQTLCELVITDRLTGLGNRAALRQRVDELVQTGRPFYLLFLDLDNFKSINDRFGHTVGDIYLCRFADALQRCAGADSSFRLAGDEFVCPAYDEGLLPILEKLEPAPVSSGEPDFLGVSVGMARYPEEAASVFGLLELADQRMYRQKLRKSSHQ